MPTEVTRTFSVNRQRVMDTYDASEQDVYKGVESDAEEIRALIESTVTGVVDMGIDHDTTSTSTDKGIHVDGVTSIHYKILAPDDADEQMLAMVFDVAVRRLYNRFYREGQP